MKGVCSDSASPLWGLRAFYSGLGFGFRGQGCRVWGVGWRVEGGGFRVEGLSLLQGHRGLVVPGIL